MVRCMDLVITSAYIITRPSSFLAARPIVWINAVCERKKPSLSASRIATNDTSGRSRPSRSRLMPTSTSRSEEHTSELQSLMRNSYAVFCLNKKTINSVNKSQKQVKDDNKKIKTQE